MKDLVQGEGVERQLDESAIEALSAKLTEVVAEQAGPSEEIELSFDEKERELEEEASIQRGPVVEVASTDLAGLVLNSDQSPGETATGGALTNQDMALYVGASLLTAGAIAVALDDDDDNNGGNSNPEPDPYVLTVDSPSVDEGDSGTSSLTFTLTLDRPAESDLVVDYQTTSAGTATSGEDFDATTGSVTFAAGESTKTISVPVNGDVDVEPDETVSVSFEGDSLADDVTATGTITNDDQEVSDFTSVSVANDGSAIIGDDAVAEAFGLVFGDDGEAGSAFSFLIQNFDSANDKLVLTGINDAAGATLADLAGDSGLGGDPISIAFNEIAQELFVNVGSDGQGDVVSFRLPGVSDASLVSVDLGSGSGGGDNGGGDNGGGDGTFTDVAVASGTPATGSAGADAFQLTVADDGASGSAVNFIISDFVVTDDKIVFSGISGATGSTLAELQGDPGLGDDPINVAFNEITSEMFVSLGTDGGGDVPSLTIPGVSDASLVSIEIV